MSSICRVCCAVHGKLEKFLIKIHHSLFGKAESPPHLLDTDNHVVIILAGVADEDDAWNFSED